MFCLYNLGYGVFGIAEIYLTILCSGDIYWILHGLGEGGTESGDASQELMSVKVIRHVLNLTPDRLGRWGQDDIESGSWVWVASASWRWLEIEFLP